MYGGGIYLNNINITNIFNNTFINNTVYYNPSHPLYFKFANYTLT